MPFYRPHRTSAWLIIQIVTLFHGNIGNVHICNLGGGDKCVRPHNLQIVAVNSVMDSTGPRSNSFKSPDRIGEEPDLEAAEVRARQAFGLTSPSDSTDHRSTAQITRAQLAGRSSDDRQRTRFVQDGEVPVVYLPGSTPTASPLMRGASRLATTEAALEAERQARQQAERALIEAQSALHEVQTRLGHANLGRAEADETLQKLQAENAELTAQLALARTALQEAEEARQHARGGRARSSAPRVERGGADVVGDNADEAARQVTGIEESKTGVRKADEPKPVRWW